MTAPLPRGASPAGSRAPATEKRDIILRVIAATAVIYFLLTAALVVLP